jgi:serine/threonine-protein kinase
MKLQPGITLQGGKYLLNQPLGQGGVGATYLATQTLLKQAIVIKTLDPSWQVTQSFSQLKARFIEDMRLLACSQHSSIVRVFDFFQEEALPFLVMEHIPGQTLYDRITTEGTFSEVEALHYIRQVSSALSVAHRHGLIHRNLSPKTIIRKQGTNLAVLVGFGLGHDIVATHAPTQNPFAPPIPNWDDGNRFAIDLYALSATLYYLLTGEVPTSSLNLDQKHWLNTTKHAILRGLTTSPQWQLQTIEDWLKLLPNTSLPLMTAQNQEAAPHQNALDHTAQTPPSKSITTNGATVNGTAGNGTTKHKSTNLPEISRPAANGTVPTKLTATPTEKPSPPAVATVAGHELRQQPRSSIVRSLGAGRHLPKFLVLTIAAATAMGAGFGFALRISATKAPGTSILHPAQAFEEKEWKGSLTVKDGLSEMPVESAPQNFRNAVPNPRQPKSTQSDLMPVPSTSPQLPSIESPGWYRPIAPNPVTPRARKPQPVEPAVPSAPSEPAIEPLPPQSLDNSGAPSSTSSSSAPAPATVPPAAPNGSTNQELPPTVPAP